MKQILSLTLALALTAALFTGCACSANVSTEPNGMITEEPTTRPTVMPTPTATHEPTRPMESTLPTVTGSDPTGTMPTGNSGDSGAMGGDIGGSGGTNGGTGSNESTAPTEATTGQRGRTRNTTR